MSQAAVPCPPTLGVILAGGLARRMGGGDKPLLTLGGRTLLDHAAARLASQCDGLILSINGEHARFEETGLALVPDTVPGRPGPLAGILAALEWASAHRPSIAWVASVPGDTPFIPGDLVARLHEARAAAECPLACASSGSHIHYAVGLWPVHLRHDLRHAVTAGKIRSIKDWATSHGMTEVPWPAEPVDPFFNINTPDELAHAETLLEQRALRP